MDPITVAARRFLRDLERFWKRHPGRVARLVADSRDRGQVLKALRLAEYDPSNRRPLFVHEVAFDVRETYFDGLCEQVLADYALLRKGAAEEGVTLAALDVPRRPAALAPEAHAAAVLAAVTERLAGKLDGALVALLPKTVSSGGDWRSSVERLLREPRPPALRLAVLDPDNGPLAGVLGDEAARFSFDMDALLDFAEQQVNRSSQGPGGAAGPTLSPDQREEAERRLGRKLASPDAEARIRGLFLKGARAAAKNNPAAAAEAYSEAAQLCHKEGLFEEEAAASFATAGACFAAGARSAARSSYAHAAKVAGEREMWNVACQAKLGEAGVEWAERRFEEGARVYADAEVLAERAGIEPLRIEALRMEGLCHQHRGAEPDAIRAWRKAVDVGMGGEVPARQASTFRDVVTTLADLLDRRGLRPQAAHLRTLLDAQAKPTEQP